MADARPESKKAPLVIFGAMILIALVGLLVVLISHCRRDEPYLDSDQVPPGQPGRVHPPTVPPSSP